ncbi:MAG: MATE family efflux transporter, partial [Cardiobacterium hominis]
AAALLRFYCSGASLLFGCKGMIFFINAAYNNLGRPFYSTASNLAGLMFGALPLISLGAWLLGPRGIILGHMAEAILTAPVCWLVVQRLVSRLETASLPRHP